MQVLTWYWIYFKIQYEKFSYYKFNKKDIAEKEI